MSAFSQEHVIMISLASVAASANNYFLSLSGYEQVRVLFLCLFPDITCSHSLTFFISWHWRYELSRSFVALSMSGSMHFAATDVIYMPGKVFSSLTDKEIKHGVNWSPQRHAQNLWLITAFMSSLVRNWREKSLLLHSVYADEMQSKTVLRIL